MGLALVLASLGIGYQVGTLSNSIPAVTSFSDTKEFIPEPKEKVEGENIDEDEGEELEDISDGDLGSISAGFLEPCKLVRLIIPGIYHLLYHFFFLTGIGSGCSFRS